MFTWICPQCGREVPPAYTECPDCAAKAAGGAAPPPAPPPTPQTIPPQPMAPPPAQAGMPSPQQPYPPYPQPPQYPQYPPPQYQQPPQQAYQQPVYQQPQYQPPQYPPPQYQQPVYQQPQYQQQYPPPPPPPPAHAAPPQVQPPPPPPAPEKAPPVHVAPPQSSLFGTPDAPPQSGAAGLPTWLLTIFCTIGFVGLVAGVYWLIGRSHSPTPSTSVESPAAKPGAATNPWQKFIEVSGVRFIDDPKHKDKILVKFVVTNHSSAGISGLAGNVTIWAATKKSDEDALGTFSFITNLGASEFKEITEPLTTKLKPYELPDWQNMTTDLQITAPAPGGSGGLP